ILARSVRSLYSEVPLDSREMFNPSVTPGACMDPYMRPPHGMMGHRGMPPPESAPYCTQSMMASHHNLTHNQLGSEHMGSGDASCFSTPRSMLKLSKKRALSISPLSDASVDLQTVIRTSPNSLVAFVNSRCGPNAASSYGHLSVGSMSPSLGFSGSMNYSCRPQGNMYGSLAASCPRLHAPAKHTHVSPHTRIIYILLHKIFCYVYNTYSKQRQLSMMGMCAPSPLLSNRRVMELSAPDLAGVSGMGMPCPPNDRRGSGTSSLSSAYTVSRRSSMVSPYLSSRRSSDVSQVGHCQSVMGTDVPGDPLSPQNSKRGGSCQNLGGLPGLPSLTPAQQYSLKAKYAAATGGPPPTPLPNMDQPGNPGRFLRECHGQPLPPFLQQGGTRRHSANTEYGTGVIYPHQAPGNNMRRASDPVRSGADPQGLPKVQRFNSLSNVSLMSRRNALQQCGSDAPLSRHMYSPRPPSITENVMMEAMAMDPHGTAEGREQGNMIQGGDRAYMGYQQPQQCNHPHNASQLSPRQEGLSCMDQVYQPQMQGPYQREEICATGIMGQGDIANNLLQQAEFGMSNCQLSPSSPHYPSQGDGSGPWGQTNQLHSPQTDMQYQCAGMQGQHYPQQSVYDPTSNPGHQRVTVKPEQFHSSMGGSSSCQNTKPLHQHRHDVNMQAYPPQSGQGIMGRSSNANCDFHHGQMGTQVGLPQQSQAGSFPSGGGINLALAESRRSQTPMHQMKEMMVRNYVQSQQALLWEQQQEQTVLDGLSGKPDGMEMGGHPQANHNLYPGNSFQGYPNQNLMSPPQNRDPGSIKEHTAGMQGSCYGPDMVPRPPQGRKPLSRQNSLSQQTGGAFLGSPTHLSPVHSTASPRRAVRLPPVQQQQQHSENFTNNNNNPMYYSGQINMHHDIEKIQDGPCLPQQHLTGIDPSTKPTSMAYSDPAPMSNALENLDLENAQIDFTSIIDDQEPSSYSPINPPLGHHQCSSQTSSRLTTPQTSITLPSGLSNMAVGDMTSMLTSLAGENKYLNTLS
uniref:GLI family zinc finger 1 n=1 Tax=Cyprinus carpio TaxID=7962 RepID=A0A8C2JVE0_CYPCA